MTMPTTDTNNPSVPTCGAPASSTGEPCRKPGTYRDGRCVYHTEADEPRASEVIREGLRAGKETEAILEEVRERCPSSRADNKHVNYYRHLMRKAGEDV